MTDLLTVVEVKSLIDRGLFVRAVRLYQERIGCNTEIAATYCRKIRDAS